MKKNSNFEIALSPVTAKVVGSSPITPASPNLSKTYRSQFSKSINLLFSKHRVGAYRIAKIPSDKAIMKAWAKIKKEKRRA